MPFVYVEECGVPTTSWRYMYVCMHVYMSRASVAALTAFVALVQDHGLLAIGQSLLSCLLARPSPIYFKVVGLPSCTRLYMPRASLAALS